MIRMSLLSSTSQLVLRKSSMSLIILRYNMYLDTCGAAHVTASMRYVVHELSSIAISNTNMSKCGVLTYE